MPSVSQAQNRFWHELEEHPKMRRKRGIPEGVVSEFLKADKGRAIGALPERKTGRSSRRVKKG